MGIIELIHEYGQIKWDEGYQTSSINTNTSIALFNKAEKVYAEILSKIEKEVTDDEV